MRERATGGVCGGHSGQLLQVGPAKDVEFHPPVERGMGVGAGNTPSRKEK